MEIRGKIRISSSPWLDAIKDVIDLKEALSFYGLKYEFDEDERIKTLYHKLKQNSRFTERLEKWEAEGGLKPETAHLYFQSLEELLHARHREMSLWCLKKRYLY
ncbi:unnamed protein product [Ambrosiozyma monospora]|uniref:Unnamed protein product n=1 Tax=Ambrosiozyma monospora TaxID=43982 RepID=A0ACB5TRC6_AMBMO|nr:unnamed protein product [Ambrosiozyma monospora]